MAVLSHHDAQGFAICFLDPPLTGLEQYLALLESGEKQTNTKGQWWGEKRIQFVYLSKRIYTAM